jgi:hypothetical protein
MVVPILIIITFGYHLNKIVLKFLNLLRFNKLTESLLLIFASFANIPFASNIYAAISVFVVLEIFLADVAGLAGSIALVFDDVANLSETMFTRATIRTKCGNLSYYSLTFFISQWHFPQIHFNNLLNKSKSADRPINLNIFLLHIPVIFIGIDLRNYVLQQLLS